ncbi:hypothetical protein [Eubacterium ramulus]|uniref:Uncharacterized protein n=1 Tax=Eubacterium ramulus ATCC 29099 TaxID=1256908 RepID=U2NZC2_EUBRA|nr:hypothetical protein [Eubacterium ramulus]ERK43475.1 hypothetical protein HMPREF0373_02415 [Eubacterium ramulus ATCC 29099]
MKNEKEQLQKGSCSFFTKTYVLSKRKYFCCSNNIPLNQYSVNSKAEIFEVKKQDENLCIFTSKQQLTIGLSWDIIVSTAVEIKEKDFRNNNKK